MTSLSDDRMARIRHLQGLIGRGDAADGGTPSGAGLPDAETAVLAAYGAPRPDRLPGRIPDLLPDRIPDRIPDRRPPPRRGAGAPPYAAAPWAWARWPSR